MRIHRVFALLFVVLFAVSACAPPSGASEFTRYPRTSITTEATGFYPDGSDGVGGYGPVSFEKLVEYSTFIFDAEFLYEKKTMDPEDPIRMVFGISRELKGKAVWNEPEITVELSSRWSFAGSSRCLLFVDAYERAAIPEPVIRASAVFLLTDGGTAVRTSAAYFGGAWLSLHPDTLSERLELSDDRFLEDPFGVVLDSHALRKRPIEVYEEVPDSYPDIELMSAASDLIVGIRLVVPDYMESERAYYSCRVNVVDDPLKSDPFRSQLTSLLVSFRPEWDTDYIAFLRRLDIDQNFDIRYDLVAREGALIEKDEIPDWEAFVAQID